VNEKSFDERKMIWFNVFKSKFLRSITITLTFSTKKWKKSGAERDCGGRIATTQRGRAGWRRKGVSPAQGPGGGWTVGTVETVRTALKGGRRRLSLRMGADETVSPAMIADGNGQHGHAGSALGRRAGNARREAPDATAIRERRRPATQE
jgi:hypothetical protein